MLEQADTVFRNVWRRSPAMIVGAGNPFAIRGGTAAPWAARSVGVYYQATAEEVANLKQTAAESLERVTGDLRASRFVYSQPTAKNNIGLPLDGKRFY